MQRIILLGSTGSIGKNALEVVRLHRDRFRVTALAAGENIHLLEKQIREFDPEWVSVKTRKGAEALRDRFPGKTILHGEHALEELIERAEADTVISAISGTASLKATMRIISRGLRLCLANKETLVAAGGLINAALDRHGGRIIPIDSEQSAIFQSIGGNHPASVQRVILTASGGPFFRKPPQEFADVTVSEALSHPTWSMGRKISIDSATLMNKALEVIETFHLFRLRPGQIDVVIHPQSIVHSMVEFTDASLIAQLSTPDMRIPILYSLTWPERLESGAKTLDFAHLGKLEFLPVDHEKFPSLGMAHRVLAQGGNSGAVFNAANEVAVEYFLAGKITFRDIFRVVGYMTEAIYCRPLHTIEEVVETIHESKRKTSEYIDREFSTGAME